MGIVRTLDRGDMLLIGIVRTIDIREYLLIGIVLTVVFGCCPFIGIVWTAGPRGRLLMQFARIIDFRACLLNQIAGRSRQSIAIGTY